MNFNKQTIVPYDSVWFGIVLIHSSYRIEFLQEDLLPWKTNLVNQQTLNEFPCRA